MNTINIRNGTLRPPHIKAKRRLTSEAVSQEFLSNSKTPQTTSCTDTSCNDTSYNNQYDDPTDKFKKQEGVSLAFLTKIRSDVSLLEMTTDAVKCGPMDYFA